MKISFVKEMDLKSAGGMEDVDDLKKREREELMCKLSWKKVQERKNGREDRKLRTYSDP